MNEYIKKDIENNISSKQEEIPSPEKTMEDHEGGPSEPACRSRLKPP